MSVPIYQVDSFTDELFRGNPAGVCILPGPGDEVWMQHVAREMNVAETAFLHPGTDGFHLRWFTPAAEVELCGHATLASAHILWETGVLEPSRQARFHTLSGLLTADRTAHDIELDFPATPAVRTDAPPGLCDALGIVPLFTGRTDFDYLIEVDSEETVRRIAPDIARLRSTEARGVVVTSAASTPGFDFVSRFFAPAVGIDEDPVTGSAHCCLGPFWSERLGKTALRAYQASARGGTVRVEIAGGRVKLGGRAVTFLRGTIAG